MAKTKKTKPKKTKKPTKTKKAKTTKKKAAKPKAPKPIGVVTHFFGHIEVAIVKFKRPVKVGEEVCFRGHTTDFCEKIKSMQFDHESVPVAKKNQEVGIKVGDKVREGDEVFAKE